MDQQINCIYCNKNFKGEKGIKVHLKNNAQCKKENEAEKFLFENKDWMIEMINQKLNRQ